MSTTTNIDVGNTWVQLVDPSAGTVNADIGNASGAKMELFINATAPAEGDTGLPVGTFSSVKFPEFAGGIWGRCKVLADTVTVIAVVVEH